MHNIGVPLFARKFFSYQSRHNGTDGFSETNLIGSGNFSSVYKGTLEFEDKVVGTLLLEMFTKKKTHGRNL